MMTFRTSTVRAAYCIFFSNIKKTRKLHPYNALVWLQHIFCAIFITTMNTRIAHYISSNGQFNIRLCSNVIQVTFANVWEETRESQQLEDPIHNNHLAKPTSVHPSVPNDETPPARKQMGGWVGGWVASQWNRTSSVVLQTIRIAAYCSRKRKRSAVCHWKQ